MCDLVSMLGVYFESWEDYWADKVEDCALAKIEGATHVFLSFVYPNCGYKKSQGTWYDTGLEFTCDFQIIRQSIKRLQSRGIKVILSVGGASYISWEKFNPLSIALLCYDLEADGFDLDYEPINYFEKELFIECIKKMKPFCVSGQTLSIAGFAGGCLTPEQQPYRGTLIPVLEECKNLLDFVNIMNYDAGKDWDYHAAYRSYEEVVDRKTPLNWGLQVGKQGWGDALLTEKDVLEFKHDLAKGDGFFVWAYFKSGSPDFRRIVELLKTPPPELPPMPIKQKLLQEKKYLEDLLLNMGLTEKDKAELFERLFHVVTLLKEYQ